MTLTTDRDEILASARQIVDTAKSAGRDLDGDEVNELTESVAKIKSLNERIELSEKGNAALKAMGFRYGDGIHSSNDNASRGYMDLSPAGMKRLGDRFAERMTTAADMTGRKSLLAAGESVISIPLLPADPVTLAQPASSLLSVLPTITIPAGAQATYIRQGSRVNNAAAVQPGDAKPVSVYGLTAVPVQLHVYAHLSEATDRFLIDDAPVLAQFLASELLYGVTKAVEADVISGAAPVGGAAPAHIQGVLTTSGIISQAFTTDLLTSLRGALTTAQGLGYDDSLVYLLSPGDWAAAELSRASTSGSFDMSTSPVDAAPRRVWGIPVIVVAGLPAKTGILLDRSAVAIYTDRQGVRTDWGSPADTWSKNQVVARCEGRFDLATLQPNGICKIATAAA